MRRTSGRGSKPVEVFDPVKEAAKPQVRRHSSVLRFIFVARLGHCGLNHCEQCLVLTVIPSVVDVCATALQLGLLGLGSSAATRLTIYHQGLTSAVPTGRGKCKDISFSVRFLGIAFDFCQPRRFNLSPWDHQENNILHVEVPEKSDVVSSRVRAVELYSRVVPAMSRYFACFLTKNPVSARA